MRSTVLAILAAATAVSADAPARFSSKPLSKTVRSQVVRARAAGDSNWGGAVQEGNGWTYVTGTATVPSITGQSSEAGAAGWVGIDGDSCQNAILQTGFAAFGDGSLEAWYEWFPEPSFTYDLDISAGDQLRMTVFAHDTNSGNSTIENLTTGQSASHQFENMSESLCLTDAEWIVEDFESGGESVPFANFGDIDFTDAEARSPDGTVTPKGSEILEVTVNGQPRTSCSASPSGVDCTAI